MAQPLDRPPFPLVPGWFSTDARGEPFLLGSRCRRCGDFFFPRAAFCRNPQCTEGDLEEVRLGRRGRLWSYTVNHYEPPPPYVPSQPFVPYGVAVVELPNERLMVLGQVARGCDPTTLRVGMEMELVVEPLYVDPAGNEVMAWKWKPC